MQLIRQGAEAKLYVTDGPEYFGVELPSRLVLKQRVSKRYRIEQLDSRIVLSRTLHEAKLIHDAKRAGVATPALYFVDRETHSLVMEYVEGPTLKEVLQDKGLEALGLLEEVGAMVARLHKSGIVHGDLTTSNIILSGHGLVLIDFGLGESSPEIEKHAVDLHLLKQALKSTHYDLWKDYWDRVVSAYIGARDGARDVMDRIDDIELRGRYVQRGE